MEAKKINLSDFVLFGGGANGESYNHKQDPSLMLKLYFPGKIQQPLDEMLLARKVYEMGIPTPEPGEYVETEDGRFGILFRRIEGKLVAQSYMMIEYDCPAELLQKACELTPGLDAPTVTKLHGREWYSVKAMVPQEEANAIMDKLWDAGARSILLFGIKSARI